MRTIILVVVTILLCGWTHGNPVSNCILVDVGNCLLANTANPILVQ